MDLLLVWATAFLGEVPLPGTSSVTVGLAPPSACVECHGNFDVKSAYETWVGSVMGNAARDPLFLSALTESQKDAPNTGDFCMRCHATEAWLNGRCVEPDGRLLTSDDSGVTCVVCHRMDPSPWLRNGQFLVGEDLDYRGPYEMTPAPHHHQKSAWVSSSELCASCHDFYNVLTERKELDGTPMGVSFPEQTTYSEWASSAFATGTSTRSCQDCHMPEETGKAARDGPVRTDRSSHELTGGNLFLPAALAFLEPGLGISDRLLSQQARSRALLGEAAKLEVIEPPPSVARGASVKLTLRITNLAGHKLPTGYPVGRRVWLELASVALEIDLGRFDDSSGEPIDPLAIYEAKQGQFAIGAPGHRLALNDVIFSDTRIPPRDMIPTATTAPVGKTFPESAPGVLAGYDEVAFDFAVPCDPGLTAVPIEATLWYQSVTKAYVDALVAENGDIPRAMRLAAAFEEVDPGPIEMESLTLSLPIEASSSCEPPDSGVVEHDLGLLEDAHVPDAGSSGSQDAGAVEPSDAGCGCRATNARSEDGAIVLLLIALCVAWSRRSSR